MADARIELLRVHLRQLRLPSMSREFERLARDAAAADQDYFEFLLSLTESELATRAAAAVERRIKEAKFPILKDFDTYDFTPCRSFPSRRYWSWRVASGSNTSTIVASSAVTVLGRLISRSVWAKRRVAGGCGCDSSRPRRW